jgi:hypothetical protein
MRRSRRSRRPWWHWLVGALVLLVVIVGVASRFIIDEPLRRRVEAQMNASLKGYKVRIGKLHFNPIGLSVDLVDWVVVQEANPDPPVAKIPRLHASVQWTQILRGHLVSDFRFDHPSFHVDFRKAQSEAKDKTPVHEKGWQDAALAVYPLKINLLRIDDGEATYVEPGPMKPLHVTGLQFRANNIRNVHSKTGVYPSPVHVAATIVDTAKLRIDGDADFLAEPTAAIKTDFSLDGLRLDWLEPILHHYDIAVRNGTLSARGQIEYAPTVKTARLTDASVDRADLSYVKRRGGQPTAGEKAAQVSAKVTQQPSVAVRVDRFKIADSKLDYRNETTDPAYNLFVSDCNVTLTDFSNVAGAPDASPGKAGVTAKFMGSGDTHVDASFRPRKDRTDFQVALRIDDTDVTKLNDLWRAYGGFDMEAGTFAFYSEIGVREGRVDGYVKPIFRDLKIMSPDEHESLPKKVYEGIVAGAGKVLTNPPHDQIATQTDLSGPLANPHASVLQITGNLFQNAFFKAILPGLDRWRKGSK